MSLEAGLMYALGIVVATAFVVTGFALWLQHRDDRKKNGDES